LSSGSEITSENIVFDALVETRETEQKINFSGSSRGLKDSEQDMILDALRRSNGNRKIASENLGISGRTLRYKLAKYKEQGVSVPEASLA